MRQSHKGGEKVFVDYSGDKIDIHAEDGILQAEIFVGVLGASNYIYLEATLSQKLCDWVNSHIRMFEHFGGVPLLVVPDNLKSGVIKANRYDPDITPDYYQMLSYYKSAAMPARIYTPKDKAKAENGVLIVQRWVLARLRRVKFASLYDLNQELAKLMDIINNKKMKLYPYTRCELFEILDKPALIKLPEHRYQYREYKKARVGADYHIELHGHYYSVPYNLVKEEVDIWYTVNLVECYHRNIVIAKHVRSYQIGKTTETEHMPINHQKYAEISIEKVKEIAKGIGIATSLITEQILEESPHEAIGCRKSYGFLKLAKQYGNNNLEEACNYAINIGVYNYKNVEVILKRNISSQPLQHSNIRGSSYYN
jgi:transposase